MDKHTARERDRQWKEVKANHEKLELAQLSYRLLSPQELREMILTVKDGQCLVICDDGSIYIGEQHHVKKEKMTKKRASFKVADKIDTLRVESDMKSAEEMYPMHLNGYRRAGNWDTRTRLAGESAKKRGGRKAEVPTVADDI